MRKRSWGAGRARRRWRGKGGEFTRPQGRGGTPRRDPGRRGGRRVGARYTAAVGPLGMRHDRFPAGIPRICAGTRRAAVRGVRHQGRAPDARISSMPGCSTTARACAALGRFYAERLAGLGHRLRPALRARPTRASRWRRRRPSRWPKWGAICRTASIARKPRTTARAASSSARRSRARVLIVDDVITAGTSVRESVELIRAHGAAPAGVLIALDRMERGQGEQSAVQEVQRRFRHSRRRDRDARRPDALHRRSRRRSRPGSRRCSAYREQYGAA